jgi:hypothetical protein
MPMGEVQNIGRTTRDFQCRMRVINAFPWMSLHLAGEGSSVKVICA